MNIVFDLDGTLIDSAPDIAFVASTILKRRNKEPLSMEQTRRFIGEGSGVFVQRMMAASDIEESGDSFHEIHEEFLALYETAVDKATFYPGVLNTLEALLDVGHSLGLCTNKSERPARAVLDHMGLSRYFSAVVAGGMMEHRKPAPDMLFETIRILGAGSTLYVGDSEVDAETAQRAAIPFALFSRGYRKTPLEEMAYQWTFDDFAALPGIVAEAEEGAERDRI